MDNHYRCTAYLRLVGLNLNLSSLPQINRCCNEASPSGRSLAMPAGAPDALREYLHGDYLMLYVVEHAIPKAEAKVVMLTIRHHRQLSFDFYGLWPLKPNAQAMD